MGLGCPAGEQFAFLEKPPSLIVNLKTPRSETGNSDWVIGNFMRLDLRNLLLAIESSDIVGVWPL